MDREYLEKNIEYHRAVMRSHEQTHRIARVVASGSFMLAAASTVLLLNPNTRDIGITSMAINASVCLGFSLQANSDFNIALEELVSIGNFEKQLEQEDY
jgi:hypothetical protein